MTDAGKLMTRRPLYETYDDSDVRLLIEQYPLAWVCAAGGVEASQLPLIGVYNAEGRLVELIGHFARANPLGAALKADPKAAILFSGPSGYVSPRQAGRGNWAPTWNYAQLRVWAEISIEPDFTATAVDMLIGHMERDAENPWTAQELGERYDLLMPMIVGFRARVTGVKAKFKLGQDERPDTLRAILGNLQNEELERWMSRFNQRRVK